MSIVSTSSAELQHFLPKKVHLDLLKKDLFNMEKAVHYCPENYVQNVPGKEVLRVSGLALIMTAYTWTKQGCHIS